MATQVSSRNACWLDGITVTGQDMRLQLASGMLTSTGAAGTTGIAATAGVRYSVGAPLAAVWQSGMGFNLNAGVCWVQGTASATAGLWSLALDTTTLLTVTASDPTNPRIDSVIVVVVDNGNGTSTSVFKILAGVPAGSPVAPTLPANALRLWNIAVAANAVVLSQGNFTDVRVWTIMAGGILPVANAALGTAVGGPTGAYVDDLNTGRLRRIDSSGNARAAKAGGVAPQSQFLTAAVNLSNVALTTIATVTITVDGLTELEITGFIYAFKATGTGISAGDCAVVGIQVDGSFVNGSNMVGPAIPLTNTNLCGMMITAYVTPVSGSRTITLVGQGQVGSPGTLTVAAFSANTSSQQSYLRAAPAFN